MFTNKKRMGRYLRIGKASIKFHVMYYFPKNKNDYEEKTNIKLYFIKNICVLRK